MFSRYFRDLQTSLIKTYAPSGKFSAAKKAGIKKTGPLYEEFCSALDGMIPPRLTLGRVAIRDRSGYTPDMADFTAYTMISKNTAAIFGSVIPFELATAAYHLVPSLDRKTLFESLIRVAHVKKCDRYEGREGDPGFIASFVVAFSSGYTLAELKQAMIEMYTSQDVVQDFEVDIIALLGKGLIIKKWGQSRSYIAIETGEDTLAWFYVLMNEYLENGKAGAVDLRSFVLDEKNYPEY